MWRHEIGNYWKTKEEAKEALEIKKIDTELRRYALEHNEGELDYSVNQYRIGYDCWDEELVIDVYAHIKVPSEIAFTSREIAEAAIEAIGRDRVEKWARY